MDQRPSSQLENARPSGLRPPSKLPALTGARTLQETSSSDLNARTAPQGAMLPPPTAIPGTIKHKIIGLPEPPAKEARKTLAQRAGEPSNQQLRTHPSNKSSITNIAGFGSRPTSKYGSYRNPSNASAASSVNGLHQSSRQASGYQPGPPRPHTSTPRQAQEDDHESDTEAGVTGKRKGTPVLSFHSAPINGIVLRKTRTHGDLRHSRARSQHSGSSMSNTSEDEGVCHQISRYSSASFTLVPPPPLYLDQTGGTVGASQSSRNVSLSTAFAQLTLTPQSCDSHSRHRPSLERIKEELSPSKIPKYSSTPKLRHAQSALTFRTPSRIKHKSSLSSLRTPVTSAKRGDVQIPRYLTKEKLSPVTAWDTSGRIDDMERMFHSLQKQLESASDSKDAVEESLSIYKARVQELKDENRELFSQNKLYSSDLDRARNELHTTSTDLRQVRRDYERELLDVSRKRERELEENQARHEQELRKLERERENDADQAERRLAEERKTWQKNMDHESANLKTQYREEMEEIRSAHERALMDVQKDRDSLKQAAESRATESAADVQLLRDHATNLQNQLDASNASATSLRTRLNTYESKISVLEQEKLSLVSKAHFLEGNQEAQSQEFTNMREKMEEAIASKDSTLEVLRKEEALRRKLNAMILELRGNIRVFVRTRPLLDGEDDPAKVDYLEEDSLEGCKEMVVHAPSTQTATGKQRNEKHNYAFDRVFTPGTSNPLVFEECRELIQSVVDGYNVSILSYGQTGSGKTYGMTGPEGIIPSSIHMLLLEMGRLKEKGWEYAVEASFVEVYNETLNDLLGDAKTWDDAEDLGASVRNKRKEKHEIHHDAATGKTTVTNLTSIALWPPPNDDGSWPPAAPVEGDPTENVPEGSSYTEKAVNNLLDTAAKNRRVAATKANERSSRSHSVFMLTLKGSCSATEESTEGVLNLVDLAGSERLKQSGAEGNRMKETQAINKSLSSLGDVIAALGNKSGNSEAHVPYRNSKLTYLLQSSLGGTTAGKSSRTLMLLHLSPLQAHWQESRSSLLFGSKVHGTHIGTAKKR